MSVFGKMKVEADGERRIKVTRAFDATREEVFDAYTKPEHVQHWLGAIGGWWMSVCEIDPRIGGTSRFVWRGPEGGRMGLSRDLHRVRAARAVRDHRDVRRAVVRW